MGSGSSGSSSQQQTPGTFSPAQATLLSLFGSGVGTTSAGYYPQGFAGRDGGAGGVFRPSDFYATRGLLANQPTSPIEAFILGAGPTASPNVTTTFDRAGYQQALQSPQGKSGLLQGQSPDPEAFITRTPTTQQAFGQRPGFQELALADLMTTQGLFQQGDEALEAALSDPTAAIALARRGFTQETVPDILERAPGFSSSDLQRELTRAGVDLDTNVAALREQYRQDALAGLPGYAEARRQNLLSGAADILGLGQAGREFLRDTSEAGDAFRVLEMFQILTGPSLATAGSGTSRSKSGSGLWG